MRFGPCVMPLAMSLAFLAAGAVTSGGRPAAPRTRIGVYDSRAIAMAYARSAEFQQRLARLFSPDEQTLKLIASLKNVPPVPFDQVSLDPND